MKKVLVILGPTATGKSDLAVSLAKKFNGEVISADSRQVYIGLDIGTGKITKQELQGIPHHLIDIIEPGKVFSVSDFVKEAEKAIETIAEQGKLPIICGGTGFYIDALIDGIVLPEVPPNEKLRAELVEKTTDELFETLMKLDPERAETIDKQNPHRLIRAIEIATALGKVPAIAKSEPRYDTLFIGLNLPPEKLKEKIKTRLDKRIGQGMIREAENLHEQGLSWERMDDLGLEYRFLASYLQKNISLDEMKEKLAIEIWHYAKRQMTWFKRSTRIHWFEPKQTAEIEAQVSHFLA